jgi:hypothetical protein
VTPPDAVRISSDFLNILPESPLWVAYFHLAKCISKIASETVSRFICGKRWSPEAEVKRAVHERILTWIFKMKITTNEVLQ